MRASGAASVFTQQYKRAMSDAYPLPPQLRVRGAWERPGGAVSGTVAGGIPDGVSGPRAGGAWFSGRAGA